MRSNSDNSKVIRMPVTAETLRMAGIAAREEAEKARRRQRCLTTVIAVIALAVVIGILCATAFGHAEGSSDRTKKLTSVYVEAGDSIWSIASKYYTPECGDMNNYVREIERTNGLNDSAILYGYTLLVPYYE